MKLEISHTILNIKDSKEIIKFYSEVLGFKVSDQGLIGGSGPEIIFMSTDPDEHHQIGFSVQRQDLEHSTQLNHISFRVRSFEEVKEVKQSLDARGSEYLPLCHGNALSLYFNDPEGNALEVFFDTPWHVIQPQTELLDPNMTEEEALNWVEQTFKDKQDFSKAEDSEKEFVNRT